MIDWDIFWKAAVVILPLIVAKATGSRAYKIVV